MGRNMKYGLGLAAVIVIGVVGWLARPGPAPKAAQAKPAAAPEAIAEKSRPKVLLIQSYHAEYEWCAGINRGVRRALAPLDIELEILHMDTKRNPQEEMKQKAGQVARDLIDRWQPDVIIAADDNAQKYVTCHYVGREKPQIVFCGVNAEMPAYGFPAPNATGVLERPHFAAGVAYLRKLVPSLRKLAIVSDDSETSDGGIAYMKKDQSDCQIVLIARPGTFDEWKKAIVSCQDTADIIAIYMYHTVKDPTTGMVVEPKTVMGWTAANSRIPILGFFVFGVDDGALCGYLESGVEHGYKAGQMAMEILNGKSAGQIPILTALEGQSMLNLHAADALKIPIPADLPGQTDVLIGVQK